LRRCWAAAKTGSDDTLAALEGQPKRLRAAIEEVLPDRLRNPAGGRLLKRGRFASTEELKQRLLDFIAFCNQTLAKPFRWIAIGKPLMA
jgi:hypothetical protein